MVLCPACNHEVIPVARSRASVSKHCPLCDEPLTNLGCRTAVQFGPILMVVGFFLALLLGGCKLVEMIVEPAPEPIESPVRPISEERPSEYFGYQEGGFQYKPLDMTWGEDGPTKVRYLSVMVEE